MESGEEPTEVTAMTSGESGISSSDDSGSVPLDTSGRTTHRHNKAVLKQYLRSSKGRCVFAIVLATLLVLACYIASKLIIGFMFIGSCQLDPFIPIYLITSASFLVIFVIVFVVIIIRCRRDEGDDRVSPVHLVTFVYFFVHLVLQLAGSVCVIRTRNLLSDIKSDEQKQDAVSCDDTLLTYSFGVIIFELILSALLFIIAVISLCEVIYLECCQETKQTKLPTNA